MVGFRCPLLPACLTYRCGWPRFGRRLTQQEELNHRVKEVWPEGVVIIADALTLHEASTTVAGSGPHSQLEEVSFKSVFIPNFALSKRS